MIFEIKWALYDQINIYSSRYDFSMTKTLEKYQKCSYNASESMVPSKDTQVTQISTLSQIKFLRLSL
uniref:MADS46 n=1 Tax=Erycina pusilla TaxID=154679 RepID=A0A1L1WKX7_9ASPA|nr:MADS46 [Erycina pusilla]